MISYFCYWLFFLSNTDKERSELSSDCSVRLMLFLVTGTAIFFSNFLYSPRSNFLFHFSIWFSVILCRFNKFCYISRLDPISPFQRFSSNQEITLHILIKKSLSFTFSNLLPSLYFFNY